jgi:Na+-driven multidrug efflux pump
MPAMAIGAAVSAMAAQNIGAGRWDRVGRITGAGLLLNAAITGAMVALVLLLDRQILGLFLGADSPALPIAQDINRTASWGFILFGATMVLFGVVRANGAVWGPLLILFIAMFPVRLGVVTLMEPMLGVAALWWSFPAGSAMTVALAALYYRFGPWRRGRMLVPYAEGEQRSHADIDQSAHPHPAG